MCANFVFMCESTCAFILSAAPTFAGEDADAIVKKTEKGEEVEGWRDDAG